MVRVLLVIEDYSELLYLQTLLKKLGLDVDGVQSARAVEESILAFNPEMIIATARGSRVNGIQLAESLSRGSRGYPKVALLASAKMLEKLRQMPLINVDALLEVPTVPGQVIACVASLGDLDQDALSDKYNRLKASLAVQSSEADREIIERDRLEIERQMGVAQSNSTEPVSSKSMDGGLAGKGVAPSRMTDEERRERFNRAAQTVRLNPGTEFNRARVSEFTREIRAQEDQENNEALEIERQEFVKTLFNLKKKSS